MNAVWIVLYAIVWVFFGFLWVRFVVDWVQVFARSWVADGAAAGGPGGRLLDDRPADQGAAPGDPAAADRQVALDLSFIIVMIVTWILLSSSSGLAR